MAVAQPEPHHDGDRRGVLEQQRHADLHVGDGVEVAELRAGHRGDAVDGRSAGVPRGAGASGREARVRRGPRAPRGDGDPQRHRRRRRSSRRRAGHGRARRTGRTTSPTRPRSSQAGAGAGVDAAVMGHSRHGHDTRGGSCNVSTCFSRMTRTPLCRRPSRWPTPPTSPATRSARSTTSRRSWARWSYTGRHDATPAELDAVRRLRPALKALLLAERDEAVELVNGMLAKAKAVPQLRATTAGTGTSTPSTPTARSTSGSWWRPRWRWST